MRVLLFGASGFIGGHVRGALTADPRITAVLCPGRDTYDLVRGDPAGLTDLVAAAGPDVVVNCTGRLSGTGHELTLANTAVTAKLIDALARAAPGARLVRLGSAAEYGAVAAHTAASEDLPCEPVSEYGITHLAATRLLALASAAGRVDGITLRVFNPIGAGLHPDNLLGRAAGLLRRALADSAGDRAGSISLASLAAHRDFVDVRDVAAAVLAAATVPALPDPRDPAGLPGRACNIAGGQAVTCREAVRLLAGHAGFDGTVREEGTGPARSAAVGWMLGDITRARTHLGWQPVHDLTDSLAQVWAGSVTPDLLGSTGR